ncbi:hypothetical protein M2139_001047 [Enterococcus sp. PF1-24]|uniref:hypothetical protein n=1 Tax=unclassified Enterococcus TaxID=2608891 RepID=UPI0024753D40|nr:MULTISPECIES: hypothetical protein [unclassified Enterococcus]MDH6364062.1 hypothetical protein [Enterococcus sp. PFB1-1]MDH6401163.1 hypothetical protein [Enterococcus sp. PF1-24]
MKNDYLSKWRLFVTSYLPLYLWLLLSNINYNNLNLSNLLKLNFSNKSMRLILCILICISLNEIFHLFRLNGSEKIKLPKNIELSPESDSSMNYIITYFTPLLSFNMNDYKSVTMNLLLFLLIGLMYVGSSATYLNPVLGIFGLKIFGVSNLPNAHHIISNLSFDEFETVKNRGDFVIRYRLGDGIYIVKNMIQTDNDDRQSL